MVDEEVVALLSSTIKASNAVTRAVARAIETTETHPKLTPTSEAAPTEAAPWLVPTGFS